MKPTPQETGKKAIWLMKKCVSTRETAKRLKISKSTAARIHLENKENMKEDKGGRPRKIPVDTVEHLKVNMKRGILKASVEAMNEANRLLPRPVSLTTIQRHLKEVGLIAKNAVKKTSTKKRTH